MHRTISGLALWFALLSWPAQAQVIVGNGIADGGWLGEKSSFFCSICNGFNAFVFEARTPTQTYAQTNFSKIVTPFQSVLQPADFSRFSSGIIYHLAGSLPDAGRGSFGAEVTANIDPVCDSAPGTVTAVLDGGTLSLTASPAGDALTGVSDYGFFVVSQLPPVASATIGRSNIPALTGSYGPGTWYVFSDANDGVVNYCGTSLASSPVTIVADAMLAVPPAPTPGASIFPTVIPTMDVTPFAEVVHAMSQYSDGGTFAGPYANIVAPTTLLRAYVGNCVIGMRTRVSGFIDGGITPWSAWSVPYDVDPDPPTAPGNPSLTQVGTGAFSLTWSAASDACTGVMGYTIAIVRDGAAFGNQGSFGLSASLNLPAPGTYTVRVTAYDRGGLTGPSSSASYTYAVVDAGPDAGVPDAGIFDAGFDAGRAEAGVDAGSFDAGFDAAIPDASVDAGPVDAGPVDAGPFDAGPFDAGFDAGPFDAGPPAVPGSAQLSVGCDCSQVPSSLLLALVAVGLLRRRRPARF